MTSGICSDKQVRNGLLESRQRKSLCKRPGQSLTWTFMEQNLYKTLSHWAWLVWLVDSWSLIGHRENTENWKVNLCHILDLEPVLSSIRGVLSTVCHHHREALTTSCRRIPTAPLPSPTSVPRASEQRRELRSQVLNWATWRMSPMSPPLALESSA